MSNNPRPSTHNNIHNQYSNVNQYYNSSQSNNDSSLTNTHPQNNQPLNPMNSQQNNSQSYHQQPVMNVNMNNQHPMTNNTMNSQHPMQNSSQQYYHQPLNQQPTGGSQYTHQHQQYPQPQRPLHHQPIRPPLNYRPVVQYLQHNPRPMQMRPTVNKIISWMISSRISLIQCIHCHHI